MPVALAPADQLTLSINYYVLSALQPLPAQIEQNDKQYVLHTFSAYAPSAYTTLKQKTKLKLPTTDVPDYTTLPEKLNAEGKVDRVTMKAVSPIADFSWDYHDLLFKPAGNAPAHP